jgi:hypothetical protein
MSGEKEAVHGYIIKESVVFDNDRGFALGENLNAVTPFVTWQFTEENGQRDYYWGHYTADGDAAKRDFDARAAQYQADYGVAERPAQENYHYYTTYPLDIGTFPKTPGGPIALEPFDKRELVEGGTFRAWGVLTYNEPLTDQQLDRYELRAAQGNPDRRKPSITAQLAEGAARAAKDNVARAASEKNANKDR